MRIRPSVFFSAALLFVPALAEAQRLPRIRSRGPARPAELPPMPGSVAREMSYRRLPYSVESYPTLSYFSTSGSPAGRAPRWISGGLGTRVDLRVARATSITLDMGQSFVGSPTVTQTLELGTRLRPDRPVTSDRRIFPFLDVRAGYVSSLQNRGGVIVTDPWSGGTSVGPGSRYSQGFGGTVGGGVEFAVTRMISLTTAGGYMRAAMRTRSLEYGQPAVRFAMNEYRYVVGLRFNPVRAIGMPGGDLFQAGAPAPQR